MGPTGAESVKSRERASSALYTVTGVAAIGCTKDSAALPLQRRDPPFNDPGIRQLSMVVSQGIGPERVTATLGRSHIRVSAWSLTKGPRQAPLRKDRELGEVKDAA